MLRVLSRVFRQRWMPVVEAGRGTGAPSSAPIGDGSSVVDLSAASLLAPLVELDHPDMSRPRAIPASLAALYERFSRHPGVAWVRGPVPAASPVVNRVVS